jgi:ribulose-phosphate 3-epimerase
MKKVEIIPAILPKDFNELEEKIGLVQGFVKTVQIDVCDGQFVPNATWPYRKHDETFDKIIHEERGLPAWEKLDFEIDLMINIKKPEDIQNWVLAGASRIIIHVESKGDIAEAIILASPLEVGLALDIETPIDVIEQYKDWIKFIQCMGIDHIGFQGQAFDAKVIEKVKSIKARYPELLVSIDGGVSLDTAPLLIAAGADRLVVGSAIFDSENAIDAVQKFKSL